MNELIKIDNKNGIETVNARELHGFLESKQDFSTWIKSRIEKYEFIENTDYVRLHKKMEANNAKQIDYFLTIEMAKELSMVENNQKGKDARQYFINIEKRARELSKPKQLTGSELLAAAVIEAQKVIAQKDQQIEAMKPAAQFYADVTGSRDAISIGEAAKIIGMGYGQNQLFELLRDFGVLMMNNQPYQSYIDRGWFRVVEQKYEAKGETRISIKTLVYQKGIDGIIKMIRASI